MCAASPCGARLCLGLGIEVGDASYPDELFSRLDARDGSASKKLIRFRGDV